MFLFTLRSNRNTVKVDIVHLMLKKTMLSPVRFWHVSVDWCKHYNKAPAHSGTLIRGGEMVKCLVLTRVCDSSPTAFTDSGTHDQITWLCTLFYYILHTYDKKAMLSFLDYCKGGEGLWSADTVGMPSKVTSYAHLDIKYI